MSKSQTIQQTATTFDQLWQVACQSAERYRTTPQSVFQAIGLRLERPTHPWQYYCTPKNVKTFASTGLDGVHYSFLESEQLRYSPIVMTIPMSFDNANIIVAETLQEFLCLGCRASYLRLELLATCDADFSFLKSHYYAKDLSIPQVNLLQVLSERLSLYPLATLPTKPSMRLERRMAQLQAKYLDFLQMGERSPLPVKSVAPAAFSFGQFG